MFSSVVPITLENHKDKKIKPISHFGFAKDLNIAAIMLHEFSRAAALYPIVFLEDKELDQFRPMVLMGFEQGENLFVTDDGGWKSSYIPAIIRRYPFTLAQTKEAGRFTVCIDEKSDLVNTKEGQSLFTEQGEQSEVLERVKKYLGELQQMERITHEFCKYFAEKNMFTPLNMRVRQANKIKNIAGCYVINEERLNNLSDDRFLELRTKRYLPAVYSHLGSLGQIERLLRLKDEQSLEKTEGTEVKKTKSSKKVVHQDEPEENLTV